LAAATEPDLLLGSAFTESNEERDVDGVTANLVSVAKAVDFFKFRNKIGLDMIKESWRITLSDVMIPPRGGK
jgi:hypothetical protein